MVRYAVDRPSAAGLILFPIKSGIHPIVGIDAAAEPAGLHSRRVGQQRNAACVADIPAEIMHE